MQDTLEVQEVSLEKVIETKLVQANVTDQVLNALKKKYGGLKLASIDDKQGYLIIKDARKEVRKVGVLTEKLCKQGREDAIAIQKKWLAKEKEILGKIALVQNPLDAEIDRFDNEVARKEQEEINRKEQAYMQRQTTLLKMEAKWVENSFVLGNVSYEINNIRDAEDEVWEETILPKYQREFEKIEFVRAELEKEKAADIEKLRIEKEKFELEQSEFRKQQESFRLQQKQLQDQQDEANRVEREKQQELQNKERERISKIQKERFELLYPFNKYGQMVDMNTLWELSETDFDAVLKNKSEAYSVFAKEQEKAMEEKRLADIEQAKQDAIRQEQERIAEQNRLDNIKRQQEEQQRQEEAAKASDKDKWAALVQVILAVNIPEFKSGVYKRKASILIEKMREIKDL